MSTADNDDFQVPELGEHPTPDERAEYVILRLEQFIRDGRTIDEGMSFKKWQTMAKTEIALAIAEAQNPVLMASAMKKAVESGREAFLAGRMPRRLYASASSPIDGTFF